MAQDLRDALPVAQGVRAVTVPFDNNTFYPEPEPPVPAPCFVFVEDSGSIQYSYFYIEIAGQMQVLETGFFGAGS